MPSSQLRFVLAAQDDPLAQPLLPWLQQLQAQQTELRQYEYSPLAQVQGWSELARGTPLFESLLVFENYPISTVTETGADATALPNLRVQALRALEQANYPLILVAVGSTEALRDFVLDSLTKRREVAGVRTEVVFDHLQNHVVGPVG